MRSPRYYRYKKPAKRLWWNHLDVVVCYHLFQKTFWDVIYGDKILDQLPPDLQGKLIAHESSIYNQDQKEDLPDIVE